MPTINRRVSGSGMYVGIDPGVGGGLAVIHMGGVTLHKMPDTERDIWDVLSGLPTGWTACIEQQFPRPTSIFDTKTGSWRATILKSTCLLWGSYCQLRGMLAASEECWEDAPPKRWQKAVGISPKEKGEDTRKWKNRLKSLAQRLFPVEKVTLATADALLIARYCQLKCEGRIS